MDVGIGVDLGCQTSRLFVFKNGHSSKARVVPTVTAYTDHILVGKDSIKELDTNHLNVLRHHLAYLHSDLPILLTHKRGERKVSLELLLSMLLVNLTNAVEKYRKLADPLPCVIAVPLALSAREVGRLALCAEAAGLKAEFIPSPIAITIHVVQEMLRKEDMAGKVLTLLVADLGCRFTSIAAVRVQGNQTGDQQQIEVLASRGLRLGSFDIDKCVLEKMGLETQDDHVARVLSGIEKSKVDLSSIRKSQIKLKNKTVDITSEEFFACGEPVVRWVLDYMKELVDQTDATLALLGGGGSRATNIRSAVEKWGLQTEIFDMDNATAMGAAAWAARELQNGFRTSVAIAPGGASSFYGVSNRNEKKPLKPEDPCDLPEGEYVVTQLQRSPGDSSLGDDWIQDIPPAPLDKPAVAPLPNGLLNTEIGPVPKGMVIGKLNVTSPGSIVKIGFDGIPMSVEGCSFRLSSNGHDVERLRRQVAEEMRLEEQVRSLAETRNNLEASILRFEENEVDVPDGFDVLLETSREILRKHPETLEASMKDAPLLEDLNTLLDLAAQGRKGDDVEEVKRRVEEKMTGRKRSESLMSGCLSLTSSSEQPTTSIMPVSATGTSPESGRTSPTFLSDQPETQPGTPAPVCFPSATSATSSSSSSSSSSAPQFVSHPPSDKPSVVLSDVSESTAGPLHFTTTEPPKHVLQSFDSTSTGPMHFTTTDPNEAKGVPVLKVPDDATDNSSSTEPMHFTTTSMPERLPNPAVFRDSSTSLASQTTEPVQSQSHRTSDKGGDSLLLVRRKSSSLRKDENVRPRPQQSVSPPPEPDPVNPHLGHPIILSMGRASARRAVSPHRVKSPKVSPRGAQGQISPPPLARRRSGKIRDESVKSPPMTTSHPSSPSAGQEEKVVGDAERQAATLVSCSSGNSVGTSGSSASRHAESILTPATPPLSSFQPAPRVDGSASQKYFGRYNPAHFTSAVPENEVSWGAAAKPKTDHSRATKSSKTNKEVAKGKHLPTRTALPAAADDFWRNPDVAKEVEFTTGTGERVRFVAERNHIALYVDSTRVVKASYLRFHPATHRLAASEGESTTEYGGKLPLVGQQSFLDSLHTMACACGVKCTGFGAASPKSESPRRLVKSSSVTKLAEPALTVDTKICQPSPRRHSTPGCSPRAGLPDNSDILPSSPPRILRSRFRWGAEPPKVSPRCARVTEDDKEETYEFAPSRLTIM